MWPVITGIKCIGVKRPIIVAGISALLWIVFHSLQTPVWGLTVGCHFLYFHCALLAGKQYQL